MKDYKYSRITMMHLSPFKVVAFSSLALANKSQSFPACCESGTRATVHLHFNEKVCSPPFPSYPSLCRLMISTTRKGIPRTEYTLSILVLLVSALSDSAPILLFFGLNFPICKKLTFPAIGTFPPPRYPPSKSPPVMRTFRCAGRTDSPRSASVQNKRTNLWVSGRGGTC